MKRSISLLTLMSTVSLLAVWSAPVDSQSSEESDTLVIEEIIVTARRREESLRDVPGTVTALTQTMLESAGVQRADDFIRLTPGVSMVDAAEVGDTQVNIRGINGARDAENSFAFILDGVLTPTPPPSTGNTPTSVKSKCSRVRRAPSTGAMRRPAP